MWLSTNISQSVLIKKFGMYLEKQGRDVKLNEGYCHALSLAWIYYKLNGKEEVFFDRLSKIATWDGKEDLDEDFEKLINLIEWLQRKYNLVDRDSINAFENDVNFISDTNQSPLKNEYSISCNFTINEIEKHLQDIVKPDKPVIFWANSHAVSLIYENNKYKFYDSNHPYGVKEFTTLKEFINDEDGLIQSFIFESTRLNKKISSKNIKNMHIPLSIFVLDQIDKKTSENAKTPGQLINEIMNDRKTKNIDSKGWDEVTSLYMACKINDEESAKSLVDLGANINLADNKGETPLSIASFYSLELIQYLIEHGKYNQLSDEFRKSLENALTNSKLSNDKRVYPYLKMQSNKLKLIQATQDNRLDKLEESLFDISIDDVKNIKNKEGYSLLHIAVKHNSLDIIKYLISHHLVDVNLKINNENAMDIATRSNSKDLVELLKLGEFMQAIYQNNTVQVNKIMQDFPDVIKECEKNGLSPLNTAILGKQSDLIEFFIDKKADLHFVDKQGNTLLHTAVASNNITVIERLQNLGLTLDVKNKSNITLLHHAIKLGKLDVVKYLIQKRLSTETLQDMGVIHLAVKYNQKDILDYLINYSSDIDINFKDGYGNTALHYAVELGHNEITSYLLSKKVDLNIANRRQKTPLHLAIERKNAELIRYLINNGANVNSKNSSSITPLIGVSENFKGNEANDLMDLLIKNGAIIDEKDTRGMTALLWSVRNGDRENVEYLLAHHAKINMIDNEGDTALHMAVDSGKIDNLNALFQHNIKIDINTKNNAGITPLHLAIQANNFNLVRSIIIHHIDTIDFSIKDNSGKTIVNLAQDIIEEEKDDKIFNYLLSYQYYRAALQGNMNFLEAIRNEPFETFQNKKGETALHILIEKNDTSFSQYLIQCGKININTPNIVNETPLHLACKKGNMIIVNELLLKGANVHAKADYALQPIHFAAQGGNIDLLKKLVKAGANIDAITLGGMTPLHYAAKEGHYDLVRWLVKKGAKINVINADRHSVLDLIPPEQSSLLNILSNEAIKENKKIIKKVIKLLTPFNNDKLYPDVVKALSQMQLINEKPNSKTCQENVLDQIDILEKNLKSIPQQQVVHKLRFLSPKPKELNTAISECKNLLKTTMDSKLRSRS